MSVTSTSMWPSQLKKSPGNPHSPFPAFVCAFITPIGNSDKKMLRSKRAILFLMVRIHGVVALHLRSRAVLRVTTVVKVSHICEVTFSVCSSLAWNPIKLLCWHFPYSFDPQRTCVGILLLKLFLLVSTYLLMPSL